MRKLNAVLSITVLAFFLLHMIAGSLLMLGLIPYSRVLQHTLSGLLGLAVTAHAVVGLKLTFDTAAAIKKSGASYWRENLLFWTRRVSGLAVLLFMVPHIIIFANETGDPGNFDAVKPICMIIFALSLLLHIVTNIRPLTAGLGKLSSGKTLMLSALVISFLLLAAGAAFIVYFTVKSL